MPLRRTARALSATALTALALGTAAGAATANPDAEVSPRTVAPGDTVTVSVTCERPGPGGHPPATVEATSQAFEHGTVRLHEDGHGGGGSRQDPGGGEGPVGGGDPLLDEGSSGEDPLGEEDPAAEKGAPVEEDPAGLEDPMGLEDPVDPAGSTGADGPAGTDDPKGDVGPEGGVTYSGTARIAPAADFERDAPGGGTSEWSADGVCPAAHGGGGKKWSAPFTVSLDPSRGTGVRHGVHAGTGGTFDDSMIALVSGGVLIAGALGAAVHRLRRREPSSNR
ncbi:hypothetical protein QFZ75_001520 [Streptomyces sp. V3I8]|uniref:hypothetical protein n=1 Tax=Streptomyces sp. V3I8 TaxID=3042279 RepID=UPI00278B6E18|nr:hypothetical protein [Streptomyces sp. V3I8]MDQ1035104.1 hypothetical protein [Streptomyces sp. V3I8]